MQILQDLERLLAREESLFRAQLLREDIARLRRLRELAQSAADAAAFKQAGARIGWTQGDARTAELREPLERLLELVYEFERGARAAALDARITQAWNTLHALRMERLLGCLSSPVPKPDQH